LKKAREVADLDHVQVFLALAEELHFRRTAQHLYLTQSRVRRLVAALEREVGGQLFERTSRRVALTALRAQLRGDSDPAHRALMQGLQSAREAPPALRVGFTLITGGHCTSTEWCISSRWQSAVAAKHARATLA
jgi:DNA-binding transcriptional LysR family regulator